MINTKICRAQTVEILHCCMKRGVYIRIHLNEPLNLQSLDPTWVDGMYVVDTIEGGFFRFNLFNIVNITGILGTKAVTSMFAYFRKEEALQCLDRLFIGVKEEYELLLANIV